MLRSDLMALAERHGGRPGTPLPPQARASIERDLRTYFQTPEGKRALTEAPRIHFTDRGEQRHRAMTEDDAIDALLSEVT